MAAGGRPALGGRPAASAQKAPQIEPQKGVKMVSKRAPKWSPFGSSQMLENDLFSLCFQAKRHRQRPQKCTRKGPETDPKREPKRSQEWGKNGAKTGSPTGRPPAEPAGRGRQRGPYKNEEVQEIKNKRINAPYGNGNINAGWRRIRPISSFKKAPEFLRSPGLAV